MTKRSIPILPLAGCALCVSLAAFASFRAGRAESADAPAAAPADLSLGGETVLRLRASAGKLTPLERIGVIEDRLDRILGIPRLTPADVVVYTPAGKPPVIYAVGRKLITVDPETTAAAGGGAPLTLAIRWAKRFQQLLPLVDYRKPGDPEPDVPADPPLTITDDPTQVGGQVGEVLLGKKLVIRLRGVQNGMTAAERADMVNARFQRLLRAAGESPSAVTVEDGAPEVDTVAVVPAASTPAPAAPASGNALPSATAAPGGDSNPPQTVPGPATPAGGASPDSTAPAGNASPGATAPAGNSAPDATAPAGSAGPDAVNAPAPVGPPRPPAQIVTVTGPTAVLKIGGSPLITVTTPDATAGGQPTPRALAEAWAKNIRDALAPPAPPQPAPGDTVMPPEAAPAQTAPAAP